MRTYSMASVNKKAWEFIKKGLTKSKAFCQAWKSVKLSEEIKNYLSDKIELKLALKLSRSFGAYNMNKQENLVNIFGLGTITELVNRGLLMQRGQYQTNDPMSSRNNWYYLPEYGISFRTPKY